ncbi:hypothetical protein [Reichenbachiella sp. MALMAid0571]|uniref:hypothetical protein n=1 Tax=Reichenbachiella sp. MALMAid0571 TaxID=3143939 RepID=UPI0032DE4460
MKIHFMKISLILIITILINSYSYSQSTDCEVKIESISGSYTGDCKKDLAHGQGISKGTDTYEGEFKKGFPDGKGKYTWSNGDVYEGGFKKGSKDGKGILIVGKVIKEGYWKEDEFIGKDPYTYKVMSRDNTITKITAIRKGTDKNQVDITYQKLGRKVSYGNIQVKNLVGNFGSIVQNQWVKTMQAVEYPVRMVISGNDNFDLLINQPGYWVVTVELVK